MEISQDSTISFTNKISVDQGLKENNAILLFKSDLPFRAGGDEFVLHQVQAGCKGEVLAAIINTISQFLRDNTR